MQLYITVNAVPSDAKKFNYSKCPRGMLFLLQRKIKWADKNSWNRCRV